jgi:CubicO group peptidase (beta-lactamase class C family)
MSAVAGITGCAASRAKRCRLYLAMIFGFSSLVFAVAAFGRAQTTNRVVSDEVYWPTDGWRSSSPEAQGMDSSQLAEALDYVAKHKVPIHNLLIIRNGFVVLDANFFPFQAGELHDGASMTKSITSLIGIAIGQHKLTGVNQSVLSIFPQLTIGHRDQRKEKVTIEHLLTMTSGLDCRFRPGEITLREMMQSHDWVQFMLDLPMTAEPGSRYEYCSGGLHLLSGILSQTTSMSALEFARRELFQPLGIRDVAWPGRSEWCYAWLGRSALAASRLGQNWLPLAQSRPLGRSANHSDRLDAGCDASALES